MRVHEMRDYFGQPTMRLRNTHQVCQLLAGRRGIIVFDYDHHGGRGTSALLKSSAPSRVSLAVAPLPGRIGASTGSTSLGAN